MHDTPPQLKDQGLDREFSLFPYFLVNLSGGPETVDILLNYMEGVPILLNLDWFNNKIPTHWLIWLVPR